MVLFELMKKFMYLLASVALLYCLIIIYFIKNESKLLYHPPTEIMEIEQAGLAGAEEIFLTTEDGVKIQAWYKEPKKGKAMIVYYRGNAMDLGWRAPRLKEFIKHGYGFIIPSWRGFGKSEGMMSKQGLYEDALAAMNYVKGKGYQDDNIFIYGESLGTGMATYIAAKGNYRGLFLLTPYTTIARAACDTYPVLIHPIADKLMNHNFSSVEYIGDVTSPVLIVHGTNDKVIPHSHTEALYPLVKSEKKKKVLYEDPEIGHSNFNPSELMKQFIDFFEGDKQ